MGAKLIDPGRFRWAQPYGVLGYTADKPLDAFVVEEWRRVALKPDPQRHGQRCLDLVALYREAKKKFPDELPSVYYRGGHATLEHGIPDNIGFEGHNRRWFLFQNVAPADHGHWHKHIPVRAKRILQELQNLKADPKFKNDPRSLFDQFVGKKTDLDKTWRDCVSAAATDKALARLFFAKEILEEYGTYCWRDIWSPEPQNFQAGKRALPPADAKLLEIFEQNNGVTLHPSRNPFHLARTTTLREVLHGLAISPAMSTRRGKAWHPQPPLSVAS